MVDSMMAFYAQLWYVHRYVCTKYTNVDLLPKNILAIYKIIIPKVFRRRQPELQIKQAYFKIINVLVTKFKPLITFFEMIFIL